MDDNNVQAQSQTQDAGAQENVAVNVAANPQESAAQGQAQTSQQVQPQANPQAQVNTIPNTAYDFSGVEMPEGYEMNAEENSRFLDVIKDMSLSNEQASALVKYGTEYCKRVVDGVVEEYNNTIKGWGDTAKQELGADFDKTVALAVAARDKFPGLREALEETGAGNRVEIIRAFAKLGEYLSGDPGMANGVNAQQGGKVDPVNDQRTLYPNTDFSKYL